MLTFKQFVAELAKEEVTLSPSDLNEMTVRYGKKVLQMGHVREDGSLLVPVECILEAAQAIGSQALAEAAVSFQSEQMTSMLLSVEALVDKVAEARERKLRRTIQAFQKEPDANRSHSQWQQIEKEIFGVDYRD
jgi:hypothetical protein